jgi:Bacterial putative lipoprotein (DUF940).
MNNKLIFNKIAHRIVLFFCLIPLSGYGQSGDSVAKALVDMGFENVSWIEDDEERVFVFENTPYRLNGVGVGKAIDLIQESGLPEKKSCRVIVVENNVPQISLNYQPVIADSAVKAMRQDWEVKYDLGNSWKKIRKAKRKNSSLYKVDIVVYPEFYFRNYRLSVIYEIVLNASPAVEISLWKGMKLTGQVIFPIINDYGRRYEQIRPGFVTLSQTVRLPYNTFLTGSVGTFGSFRWGFDARAKHVLKDERFVIDARISYTQPGEYRDWEYYHGTNWTFTGHLGASFYWAQFNTNFSIKGERYFRNEYGARLDMVRNFRHASIGLYFMKVQHAGNRGYNGGFRFAFALPPYKYKRKGYLPRITPAKSFGIGYNAGNERIYGQGFKARPDDNVMYENSFNPYFIKSELLNF